MELNEKIVKLKLREAELQAELAKWEASKKGPKPRRNTLAIYAMTPETYTKFTPAGLPDPELRVVHGRKRHAE
ncbi:MAG: hypothetical protein RL385_2297 [Pseudomonadota bacterium]